jgi:hypothetical protein
MGLLSERLKTGVMGNTDSVNRDVKQLKPDTSKLPRGCYKKATDSDIENVSGRCLDEATATQITL